MAAAVKFEIVVPLIAGFVYPECFAEVSETVHHALRDLGHESVFRPEHPFKDTTARSVVFGVQHFASIPDEAIIYNFEPPEIVAKFLPVDVMMKRELWDYSSGNVAEWRKLGHKNVRHVPVGFAPQMSRIRLADERDIDVIFTGGVYNERRRAALMMIAAEGLNLKTVSGVFGAERDKLMARSKIVLNVSSNMRVFESARVSWGLTNHIAVVTEAGIPEEDFFRNSCVFAPYQRLDQACAKLAADGWKEQGEAGFEAFSKLSEIEILREALQ